MQGPLHTGAEQKPCGSTGLVPFKSKRDQCGWKAESKSENGVRGNEATVIKKGCECEGLPTILVALEGNKALSGGKEAMQDQNGFFNRLYFFRIVLDSQQNGATESTLFPYTSCSHLHTASAPSKSLTRAVELQLLNQH